MLALLKIGFIWLGSILAWIYGSIFLVFAVSSVCLGGFYVVGFDKLINFSQWQEKVEVSIKVPADRELSEFWTLSQKNQIIPCSQAKFLGNDTVVLSFNCQPYLQYTLNHNLLNRKVETFPIHVFKSASFQIQPRKSFVKQHLNSESLALLLNTSAFDLALMTDDYTYQYAHDQLISANLNQIAINYWVTNFRESATDELFMENKEFGTKSVEKTVLLKDLKSLFDIDSIRNAESRIKWLAMKGGDEYIISCFSPPRYKVVLFTNQQVYVSDELDLANSEEFRNIAYKYFYAKKQLDPSPKERITLQDSTRIYSFEEIIAQMP